MYNLKLYSDNKIYCSKYMLFPTNFKFYYNEIHFLFYNYNKHKKQNYFTLMTYYTYDISKYPIQHVYKQLTNRDLCMTLIQ